MIYTVSFEGKRSIFSVGFKSTNLPLFTNLINQRENKFVSDNFEDAIGTGLETRSVEVSTLKKKRIILMFY